jgi:hypothetical protein
MFNNIKDVLIWKKGRKSQLFYATYELKSSTRSNKLLRYSSKVKFKMDGCSLSQISEYGINNKTTRLIKHMLYNSPSIHTEDVITYSDVSDDDDTPEIIKTKHPSLSKITDIFNSPQLSDAVNNINVLDKCNDNNTITTEKANVQTESNSEKSLKTSDFKDETDECVYSEVGDITHEQRENINMLQAMGYINSRNFYIWNDRIILKTPFCFAHGDFISNRSRNYTSHDPRFGSSLGISRINKMDIFRLDI